MSYCSNNFKNAFKEINDIKLLTLLIEIAMSRYFFFLLGNNEKEKKSWEKNYFVFFMLQDA